jgi:hypothetical protein
MPKPRGDGPHQPWPCRCIEAHPRWEAGHEHVHDKVAILAVILNPLGNLALIGQCAVTRINGAVYPALPFRAEGDAVELTR